MKRLSNAVYLYLAESTSPHFSALRPGSLAVSGAKKRLGFLVTAEQKAGEVAKLEIVSTVGAKLRLLDPRTGKLLECETKHGEILEIIK